MQWLKSLFIGNNPNTTRLGFQIAILNFVITILVSYGIFPSEALYWFKENDFWKSQEFWIWVLTVLVPYLIGRFAKDKVKKDNPIRVDIDYFKK